MVDRLRTERSYSDAVFELLVHDWCIRVGMRVLEIEPKINGTQKRPDFLVEAGAERFYLECVVSRGISDKEVGPQSLRDQVLRALDNIRSADFMLAVEPIGAPSRPVRLTALVKRVTDWLASLDHAQVEAAEPEDVPLRKEDLNDMVLYLRPIPRRNTRGTETGRATGLVVQGLKATEPWDTIREPLFRKAGRYGTPDLPLVVAINAMEQSFRLEHAVEALYGTEVMRVPRAGSGQPEVHYRPDGVWNGPKGPQCTRLSAVLAVNCLDPWSVPQRDAVFIKNFWASRPVGFGFKVPSIEPKGDSIALNEAGSTLAEIFELPPNWPNVEAKAFGSGSLG
ncbi:MAG: hypothetical protein PW843_27445 [Azospirillaceae bacterium]|nr:hypothetical protein [Azospirillaceae bacterium]